MPLACQVNMSGGFFENEGVCQLRLTSVNDDRSETTREENRLSAAGVKSGLPLLFWGTSEQVQPGNVLDHNGDVSPARATDEDFYWPASLECLCNRCESTCQPHTKSLSLSRHALLNAPRLKPNSSCEIIKSRSSLDADRIHGENLHIPSVVLHY